MLKDILDCGHLLHPLRDGIDRSIAPSCRIFPGYIKPFEQKALYIYLLGLSMLTNIVHKINN